MRIQLLLLELYDILVVRTLAEARACVHGLHHVTDRAGPLNADKRHAKRGFNGATRL